MRTHRGRVSLFAMVIAVAGCAPNPSATERTASVEPSRAVEPWVTPVASASSSAPTAAFPTEAFAVINEARVSADSAAELQATLTEMAREAGMAETVMTADGMWSGATGKADGARDVLVDDQFAIASMTKSIVAAQVMKMVEAGELGLDDPVADHLPPDLDFDTNAATIRHLLGQRSGIPDYLPAVDPKLIADPLRLWTSAELLAEVPADRTPAGEAPPAS